MFIAVGDRVVLLYVLLRLFNHHPSERRHTLKHIANTFSENSMLISLLGDLKEGKLCDQLIVEFSSLIYT